MRKKPTRHRRRRAPAGSSPGVLRVDPNAPKSVAQAMSFGPDSLEETAISDPRKIGALRGRFPVVWIDVQGLGHHHTIESIGETFGLHPLALEDVINVTQRPKIETYGNTLFIVVRMPVGTDHAETEQVSIFLGPDYLLTFQERPGDCIEGVRSRLRDGRPRIRSNGPGYLAYAIIDAIVDAYFPILDHFGEKVESLEDAILADPDKSVVGELHEVRRELVGLRRVVWPMRDALAAVLREESEFIDDNSRMFWRDAYDHCIQLMDLVESYRESSSTLMDLYLSTVSNRMNEVMKVLTLIATIFIPITFVAGLYGMNFDPAVSRWNMPELGWKYGYVGSLAVMAIIAGFMINYFRRKKWL